MPSKAIINGTLQPIRQSLEINYDPTRGRVVTQEYCTAGEGLNGMALQCERNRIAYNLRSSGNRSRILMTATGEQAGVTAAEVDTWQLLGNELQNDIKQHPKFIALAPATKSAVFLALDDVQSGDPDKAVDLTVFGAAFGDNARKFLVLLLNGTTHYAVNQYVLRHTTNVSNVYTGLDTDDGSGKIYTTTQLLAEITTGWTFNCPSRITRKIEGVTDEMAASIAADNTAAAAAGLPSPHADFLLSWLKKGCTETTAANNRVDISTEYWLAEWSTLLYPTKS